MGGFWLVPITHLGRNLPRRGRSRIPHFQKQMNRVSSRFWEAFECKGVEPFYLEKAHAISYAEQRGRLGNATVMIYDEQGALERAIAPPA
jgi:hypothetical protein